MRDFKKSIYHQKSPFQTFFLIIFFSFTIILICICTSNQLMSLIDEQAVQAGYISLKESNRPIKKVQIFIKTGKSTFYNQCSNSSDRSKYEPRRIISKRRKFSSDDEYNVKSQKKDRNVTSNLIHHLIKYVKTLRGPQQIVQKIILSKSLNISYQRFCKVLDDLTSTLKTYVTIKHIKNLWFCDSEEKGQFCIIMRILTRIFFKKNGYLSVFHSNKFSKSSKMVHFRGLRMLLEMIIKNDLEKFHTTVITSLDLLIK